MAQTSLNGGLPEIREYHGAFSCGKLVELPEDNEDGKYKYCDNSAVIKVGMDRFCRIHARDTWLKAAGIKEE